MNSLRTDDIQGARPTFRHPPKSILRKRNFDNEYFQKRLQPTSQYQPSYNNHSNYLSNVNMSESYFAKSPPKSIQHQANYIKQYQRPSQLVPDIRSDRLYANPAFYPKEYLYRQPYQNPEKLNSYYSKQIQPSNAKDQYLRQQQKNYEMFMKQQMHDSYMQQSQQQNLDKRIQQKPSSPAPKQISQRQNIQQNKLKMQQKQRLSSGRSSSLGHNTQKKNVFQGLGFNIITNNKFTYNFEKTFKK